MTSERNKSPVARYQLKVGHDDAEGRFAKAYTSGDYGKSPLVTACLIGGFMLKETGLLDIVTMLDKNPAYRNLSPLEKQALLARTLAGVAKTAEELGVSKVADELSHEPIAATAEPKKEQKGAVRPNFKLPKMGQ
ncbi:hypothetical protein [Shewanella algae]|uniref:hypothetical protein n=1 Tax=Shewanella algae TaxID=38313 RepID=UPI0031F562F9